MIYLMFNTTGIISPANFVRLQAQNYTFLLTIEVNGSLGKHYGNFKFFLIDPFQRASKLPGIKKPIY